MMYRHALRVSEAITMRLDQFNLKQARVWIRRGKNSLNTERPIEGDELRAIKRYLADRTDKLPWLFISERGLSMTRQAVNYLIAQAGTRAGNVWPHMLRHSAGYTLTTATIFGCCKISWAIGIRATRRAIRKLQAVASKGCGDNLPRSAV